MLCFRSLSFALITYCNNLLLSKFIYVVRVQRRAGFSWLGGLEFSALVDHWVGEETVKALGLRKD